MKYALAVFVLMLTVCTACKKSEANVGGCVQCGCKNGAACGCSVDECKCGKGGGCGCQA